MSGKRFRFPRRMAISLLIVASVIALALFWFDSQLRWEAQERGDRLLSLQFVAMFDGDYDGPVDRLEQIKAICSDAFFKPFGGHIAYRKTGEMSFLLEEPEKRWVSLIRKDRLVADQQEVRWEGSGVVVTRR